MLQHFGVCASLRQTKLKAIQGMGCKNREVSSKDTKSPEVGIDNTRYKLSTLIIDCLLSVQLPVCLGQPVERGSIYVDQSVLKHHQCVIVLHILIKCVLQKPVQNNIHKQIK